MFNYVEIPKEYDLSTEFNTYIIAYCPDNGTWFCENTRFFFYEYPKEFNSEIEAIEYFEENVKDFIKLESEMKSYSNECNFVYLANTDKKYYI